MAYAVRSHGCCGSAELIGINMPSWTPTVWLKFYAQTHSIHMHPKKGKAFLSFCYAWDVSNSGNGTRTRREGDKRIKQWIHFIEKNELGEVIMAPKSSYNPNYQKRVRLRAGLWIPNNAAISKFVNKKKILVAPPNKTDWVS